MMAQRNLPEQRLARLLAASEGIKYTEALGRVRAFLAAQKKDEDMSFTINDSDGKAVAGDRELTPGLKKMADDVDGHIVDDQTGEQVYPVVEETADASEDASGVE